MTQPGLEKSNKAPCQEGTLKIGCWDKYNFGRNKEKRWKSYYVGEIALERQR